MCIINYWTIWLSLLWRIIYRINFYCIFITKIIYWIFIQYIMRVYILFSRTWCEALNHFVLTYIFWFTKKWFINLTLRSVLYHGSFQTTFQRCFIIIGTGKSVTILCCRWGISSSWWISFENCSSIVNLYRFSRSCLKYI